MIKKGDKIECKYCYREFESRAEKGFNSHYGQLCPKCLRDSAGTPQDLFNAINEVYYFSLDVCADQINAKVGDHYSAEGSALDCSWLWRRCWMNPPYSDPYPWVEKAFRETQIGTPIVVALLPVDPSTAWWTDYVLKASEIIYLTHNRVQFVAPEGITYSTNNKPSCLAIFRKNPPWYVEPEVSWWDWKKDLVKTEREADDRTT